MNLLFSYKCHQVWLKGAVCLLVRPSLWLSGLSVRQCFCPPVHCSSVDHQLKSCISMNLLFSYKCRQVGLKVLSVCTLEFLSVRWCLSIRTSVCLSVRQCLYVRLSVCLSIRQRVYLSVLLFVRRLFVSYLQIEIMQINDFFFSYSYLQLLYLSVCQSLLLFCSPYRIKIKISIFCLCVIKSSRLQIMHKMITATLPWWTFHLICPRERGDNGLFIYYTSLQSFMIMISYSLGMYIDILINRLLSYPFRSLNLST